MFFKANIKNSNRGFAALFMSVLVLIITLGIGLNMVNSVMTGQRILNDATKSSQAYYAAESGVEDALFRLIKGKKWATTCGLLVGSSFTTTTISDLIGGTRTIISEGNFSNRIRKVQAVLEIVADQVAFHYGAQVGEGGLVMGNSSRIKGNVFSNGDVVGGGTIENSVVVAGNGHKVQGIDVLADATVHTCENADITGTLYYVSGGSRIGCDYGSAVDNGPNEIEPVELPISEVQINGWKGAAIAEGTIENDVDINGTVTMGPVQIGTIDEPKDLTIGNGDVLKLNGTIYVTGNVLFDQNSKAQLENAYSSLSGVIVADGTIIVENGTILGGSGQQGSYILLLSTKADTVTPVINVRNNAAGAIFYAGSGLIFLKNGMIAREITGYKVQLENTAIIQYESGLENANFSNGPGGSWGVANWQEIE